MEYLDLCRMKEVGHTNKAPFRKQLSAQGFKVTPSSVHVRDAFRISTWSLSSGLRFQARNLRHSLFFILELVVIKQCYSTASTPSGLGVNNSP